MNLEQALAEIDRLNKIIEEQNVELEELRKRKVAGRRKNDEHWQASYNKWLELYKQGGSVLDISCKAGISRRTFYRYKSYYNNSNPDA